MAKCNQLTPLTFKGLICALTNSTATSDCQTPNGYGMSPSKGLWPWGKNFNKRGSNKKIDDVFMTPSETATHGHAQKRKR